VLKVKKERLGVANLRKIGSGKLRNLKFRGIKRSKKSEKIGKIGKERESLGEQKSTKL